MSHIERAMDSIDQEITDVRLWGVRQARDVTFKIRLLEGIKYILETYANQYEGFMKNG